MAKDLESPEKYQFLRVFAFYTNMYSVYIISNQQEIFYKGFTTNITQRLEYHNTNKSQFTKNKGPWKIIFIKKFDSKKEALKFS
jgi:putative endonuclease